MAKKVYRFFGIPVWSVESTPDWEDPAETEDTFEPNPNPLISTQTEPNSDTPLFGFSGRFEWEDD